MPPILPIILLLILSVVFKDTLLAFFATVTPVAILLLIGLLLLIFATMYMPMIIKDKKNRKN